jgi:hypothetical protein
MLRIDPGGFTGESTHAVRSASLGARAQTDFVLSSVWPPHPRGSRYGQGQDRAHGCATQTERHCGADETLLPVFARASRMVPRGNMRTTQIHCSRCGATILGGHSIIELKADAAAEWVVEMAGE